MPWRVMSGFVLIAAVVYTVIGVTCNADRITNLRNTLYYEMSRGCECIQAEGKP